MRRVRLTLLITLVMVIGIAGDYPGVIRYPRVILDNQLIDWIVKELGPRDWKLEPTSFLGVKFGEPLASSYPECPNNVQRGEKIYAQIAGATCWEQAGDDAVLIRSGQLSDIYIQSLDGKVASITASFRHSDFPIIEAELIAQYGEPQWRNYPTTGMKDGSKLPSQGLNWFGRDIDFFCESRSPIQGEGMLGMSNKAWERFLHRISQDQV